MRIEYQNLYTTIWKNCPKELKVWLNPVWVKDNSPQCGFVYWWNLIIIILIHRVTLKNSDFINKVIANEKLNDNKRQNNDRKIKVMVMKSNVIFKRKILTWTRIWMILSSIHLHHILLYCSSLLPYPMEEPCTYFIWSDFTKIRGLGIKSW